MTIGNCYHYDIWKTSEQNLKDRVRQCFQVFQKPNPFTAKYEFDKTKKTSKSWMVQQNGVTIQMKALAEYFLMVVFTLLLNTIHVFEIFV